MDETLRQLLHELFVRSAEVDQLRADNTALRAALESLRRTQNAPGESDATAT